MGCQQSKTQTIETPEKISSSGYTIGENDSLTVIVVHYNPFQFKRRAILVNECLSRLLETKNQLARKSRKSILNVPKLHIVAVELTYDDREPEIEARNKGFELIQRRVSSRHVMWSKEQLINLAIRRLPGDRKYIAWMDSDIAFVDEDWVEATVHALSKHPRAFAQPWKTCDMLGPNGKTQVQVTSFAQQYTCGKEYQEVSNKNREYWHPGFVWAATRLALTCTNGLIAQTLGSADRHMAMAFLNRSAETVPDGLHPSYKAQVLNWQHLVQFFELELVAVPLNIKHYWHGSLKNRQYMERWDILKDFSFDLLEHLEYDPDQDLFLWSSDAPYLLVCKVSEYFLQRKEDSNETDMFHDHVHTSSSGGTCQSVSAPSTDDGTCPSSCRYQGTNCHDDSFQGGEGAGGQYYSVANPTNDYIAAFSGYA